MWSNCTATVNQSSASMTSYFDDLGDTLERLIDDGSWRLIRLQTLSARRAACALNQLVFLHSPSIEGLFFGSCPRGRAIGNIADADLLLAARFCRSTLLPCSADTRQQHAQVAKVFKATTRFRPR